MTPINQPICLLCMHQYQNYPYYLLKYLKIYAFLYTKCIPIFLTKKYQNKKISIHLTYKRNKIFSPLIPNTLMSDQGETDTSNPQQYPPK